MRNADNNRLAELRDIILGDAPFSFNPLEEITILDQTLNDVQRNAMQNRQLVIADAERLDDITQRHDGVAVGREPFATAVRRPGNAIAAVVSIMYLAISVTVTVLAPQHKPLWVKTPISSPAWRFMPFSLASET